jgi:hypothetical protein
MHVAALLRGVHLRLLVRLWLVWLKLLVRLRICLRLLVRLRVGLRLLVGLHRVILGCWRLLRMLPIMRWDRRRL